MADSCFLSIYLILNDYLMYLYNTLCLASGVSFFIFTIFINHKFYMWSEFTSGDFVTTPKIILVIGLLFFFIAVSGLCGMIRQDTHFLLLSILSCLFRYNSVFDHVEFYGFTILQIIVLIGELVISGVIYNNLNQIDKDAHNLSLASMKQYNTSIPDDVSKRWDFVQTTLKCCGVREPKDWNTMTDNSDLPWSCCGQKQNNSCTLGSLDKSRDVGCLCKFKEILNKNSDLIIWFFMGFVTTQVLVLVLAYGRVTSLTSLHSKYRY